MVRSGEEFSSHPHEDLPQLVLAGAVGATAPIVIFRGVFHDFFVAGRQEQTPKMVMSGSLQVLRVA
jgi:hypothetical protein